MNIVYSNNRERALEKLEEINEEKDNLILIKNSFNRLEYVFEDEVWIWIRPTDYARGYKPKKCLINEYDVTLRQYREIILPSCIYCKDEDINYF